MYKYLQPPAGRLPPASGRPQWDRPQHAPGIYRDNFTARTCKIVYTYIYIYIYIYTYRERERYRYIHIYIYIYAYIYIYIYVFIYLFIYRERERDMHTYKTQHTPGRGSGGGLNPLPPGGPAAKPSLGCKNPEAEASHPSQTMSPNVSQVLDPRPSTP